MSVVAFDHVREEFLGEEERGEEVCSQSDAIIVIATFRYHSAARESGIVHWCPRSVLGFPEE